MLETKGSWTGRKHISQCQNVMSYRFNIYIYICLHLWTFRPQMGHIKTLFKHNAVSVRITALIFSRVCFSAAFPWLRPSRADFHVIPTCQCAQNCQPPLKAVDAMCNSFNTRLGRYPYHCCNGVLMPPCILRACTTQLVIPLIYSRRPAVDHTAQLLLCWRAECTAGHSAAFVLQKRAQGHVWFLSKSSWKHIYDCFCSHRLRFHVHAWKFAV